MLNKKIEQKPGVDQPNPTSSDQAIGDRPKQEANNGGSPSNATSTGSARATINGIPVSALYMSQDFQAQLGITEKRLIEARRPGQDWFRVHPDEAYRKVCPMVKVDDTHYLVAPDVLPMLEVDIRPRILITCVTSFGTPFIWSATSNSTDGRPSPWAQSVEQVIVTGIERWIRVMGDRSAYRILSPRDGSDIALQQPAFPDRPFDHLVAEAFRDYFVHSEDHPVVKRLLGR